MMCQSSAEGNNNRYESIGNRAMKVIMKAMREKFEDCLNDLRTGCN